MANGGRYIYRAVPVRTGNPVKKASTPVNWIAVISGFAAILSGIVMIYEGTRSRV